MIGKEEIDDALFWADLHGIKDVEFKTIREWLAHRGYSPPPDPPDDRVRGELETLLHRLADLGIVVEFADHLNDRELYSWLLESGHLNGHIALLPNSFIHMSPIGGCSNEDIQAATSLPTANGSPSQASALARIFFSFEPMEVKSAS